MSNREKYNPMLLYINWYSAYADGNEATRITGYACKHCEDAFETHVDQKCLFGSTTFEPDLVEITGTLLAGGAELIKDSLARTCGTRGTAYAADAKTFYLHTSTSNDGYDLDMRYVLGRPKDRYSDE